MEEERKALQQWKREGKWEMQKEKSNKEGRESGEEFEGGRESEKKEVLRK